MEPSSSSSPEPIGASPITRPEARVVGRAPRPAKPIQSVKSKIVPEPDQIQSKPTRLPILPQSVSRGW